MSTVLAVIELPGATTTAELERHLRGLAEQLQGEVTLVHPVTEVDTLQAIHRIGSRLLRPLQRASALIRAQRLAQQGSQLPATTLFIPMPAVKAPRE